MKIEKYLLIEKTVCRAFTNNTNDDQTYYDLLKVINDARDIKNTKYSNKIMLKLHKDNRDMISPINRRLIDGVVFSELYDFQWL